MLKVKLSMERLAKLHVNGAYGGKSSRRSPVQSNMGRVVDRSIASQNSIEVSLLRRHVADSQQLQLSFLASELDVADHTNDGSSSSRVEWL